MLDISHPNDKAFFDTHPDRVLYIRKRLSDEETPGSTVNVIVMKRDEYTIKAYPYVDSDTFDEEKVLELDRDYRKWDYQIMIEVFYEGAAMRA